MATEVIKDLVYKIVQPPELKEKKVRELEEIYVQNDVLRLTRKRFLCSNDFLLFTILKRFVHIMQTSS